MPTFTQTVIDNFNDNSFNTSLWSTPGGSTGITETSGALRIAALSGYPEARSTQNRNITSGILAAKISNTGSTTGGPDLYLGAADGSGNIVLFYGDIAAGNWDFFVQGAATFSSKTTLVSNFWTGWTQGDWIGIGNLGADNRIHVYKSHDGVTWTEMGSATIGGTFGKTAVGLSLACGVSGSSTFVSVFDDASFFAITPDAGTPGKVRVAGAWVTPTAVKVRSGGAWVTPTAIKVRSGGAWVTPTA